MQPTLVNNTHTLLAGSPEGSVHATAGQTVDDNLFSANIVATSGDDNGVPVLSELQHCNIEIQGHAEPLKSLKDSGAQISLIKQELIQRSEEHTSELQSR